MEIKQLTFTCTYFRFKLCSISADSNDSTNDAYDVGDKPMVGCDACCNNTAICNNGEHCGIARE